MKINLKKGDEILTGKWQNKRVKVKTVGKNELNQPTVNGKPMLKFRIKKLMPKDKDKDLKESWDDAGRHFYSIGFISDTNGTKYEVKYRTRKRNDIDRYYFHLFLNNEFVGLFEFDVYPNEKYANVDDASIEEKFRKNGIFGAFMLFAKDYFQKELKLKGISSEGMHRNPNSDAAWAKIKSAKFTETPKDEMGYIYKNYVLEHLKSFQLFEKEIYNNTNVIISKNERKNPSFEDMINFNIEGGKLEIGKITGANVYSIIKLKVDEEKRQQGIATKLLQKALVETKGELSGMASNDKSIGLNYKLGMRAFKNGKELSLEETKKQRAENSWESIKMILPENEKKHYK